MLNIIETIGSKAKQLLPYVFFILVGFVPFYFRFSTSELFEFNKLLAVYLLTTIGLCSWLIYALIKKKPIFYATRFDVPILLFIFSQMLATILSMHPYTSIWGYYTRFHAGLIPLLGYICLYYLAVFSLNKKNILRMLIITLIAGLFVSIYAILERTGHSVSCLLAPNHRSFDAECWKQEFKVSVRAFATLGQPNWLASYLISLLPLSIAFSIYQWKKKSVQFLFFLISLTMMSAVLFTQSRSGLIAGIIALAVLATTLIYQFSANFQAYKYQVKSLGIAFVTLLCSLLIFGSILTPSAMQIWQNLSNHDSHSDSSTSWISRYNSNTGVISQITQKINKTKTTDQNSIEQNQTQEKKEGAKTGGTDSGEIRKIVWRGAINVWKRYPLFGSGLETFGYSYYKDRPMEHNLVSEWNFLYNKAHNEVLNYLATTGAFGALAYLIFHFWFWIVMLSIIIAEKKSSDSKNGKNNQDAKIQIIQNVAEKIRWETLVSHAIFASSIGVFISNFFGFSTVLTTMLQFLFMSTVIIINRKNIIKKKVLVFNQNPNNRLNDLLNSGFRYIVAFVILIAGIGLIRGIYFYYKADTLYAQGKSLSSGGSLIDGTKLLQEAIELNPKEALYYDELAYSLALLASAYHASDNATTGASLAVASLETSERALELNPHQLNFYKTRARIYILLSTIEEEFLNSAVDILKSATQLAPSDPDLIYNISVIYSVQGKTEESISFLTQAIKMKPDFVRARILLSQNYQKLKEWDNAKEQLQYIIDHINPDDEKIKEEIKSLEP